MYCEWKKENNTDVEPVNSSYYHHVFNNNFNVGFNPPKSDICNYCNKIKIELQSMSDEKDTEHFKLINRGKIIHEKCATAAQQLVS
jgi:hypothetical protein